MPIYEYKCNKCNKVKEIITSKYQHVEWCKTCGEGMSRVFPTKTTFVLKGDGWYAADKNNQTTE